MAETSVPYVTAYGNITKALDKIQKASTPSRFTQDFLATKLGLSGGSARPVIPFLKRTGFLASDGTPTDLYKQFRNASKAGTAAAAAARKGYEALYEVNEYIHALKDPELKGVIVQVTGLEESSSTVKAILGSFKALAAYASFDSQEVLEADGPEDEFEETEVDEGLEVPQPRRLGLSYTINLQLPATSDIAVFNAIFKSLRDHLLR